MGMDVIGRKPKSPAGECFSATAWSWGAVYDLICDLCGDLFDEKMLRLLGSNDGAGPADQKTCTEMAKRFEEWMEVNAKGHKVTRPRATIVREAKKVAELVGDSGSAPACRISGGQLKEWVNFLRHCGGFRVY